MIKNIIDESEVPENELFETIAGFKKNDLVTPRHMLSFAKSILLGLTGLFIIGMFMEYSHPNCEVFSTCKLTLPSLATLVIGYYFGSTKR